MSEYPYNFDAKIVVYQFGKMKSSVVYVPDSITSQLTFGKSKRLRIDGEIAGIRIEAALLPTRGKWVLMVSKKLQKLIGVTVGDDVTIAFEIADQDAITVPSQLRYALEANDAACDVWDGLTPGKRRSFCYRVSNAKMVETRERRVEEVIDTLMQQAG